MKSLSAHVGVLQRALRTGHPVLEDTFRRGLDILVSSIALILLSPLLLFLSLMVKVDSPGPVLFRHERIGRNRRYSPKCIQSKERRKQKGFGKAFTLYKFRTMYANAREKYPELYRYSYSREELRTIPIKVLVANKDIRQNSEKDGSSLLGADPRITSVGHWLRRTSLDELPNLLNVLKGDMHLVGPRPDIASNIRYYDERELKILDVKPGITGLAQIRGRGLLTFKEINAYDLEYVKGRSVSLDLKILFETVPTLLKREGAY